MRIAAAYSHGFAAARFGAPRECPAGPMVTEAYRHSWLDGWDAAQGMGQNAPSNNNGGEAHEDPSPAPGLPVSRR